MEVLIYLACLILIFPYVLMGFAAVKIHKELKAVMNPTDLDLPTTL